MKLQRSSDSHYKPKVINRLKNYIKLNRHSSDGILASECEALEELLIKEENDLTGFHFEPGQAVYMTGSAGSAGINHILGFHKNLTTGINIAEHVPGELAEDHIFADSLKICAGERGIYQVLFDIHKASSLGFEINIDRIPVNPLDSVIADYLNINIFNLLSTGCSLYIVPENDNIKEMELLLYSSLISGGRPADRPVLIGHLSSDKDMNLYCGGSVSLLNRPGRDELLNILDR